MSTTKEAYIRYRIIDASLNNKYKPYPSLQEIIDLCYERLGKRFSVSTIQKDIYAMRYDEELGFMAPIEYNRENRGYYYTETNYTITSIPLTDDEIKALEFSLTSLNQLSGMEIYSHLTGAVDKITNALSISKILKNESADKYIQIENAPSQKGCEYLGPVLRSIMNQIVLSIAYKPFYSDKAQDHIIHPYLLKEYRNRWYLIGFHGHSQSIRTFALDRIVSIIEKPGIQFRQNDFAPEIYYRNTIGITSLRGDPPEVVLKFNKEKAQYVITQPLHESQMIKNMDKDYTIISLHVHPNYELQSIILGYGDAVEVLQPKELRDKIKQILDNTRRMYS